MTKPIILTRQEWEITFAKIKITHPRSTWMIKAKFKEVMGFTVREHKTRILYNGCEGRGYKIDIHLDFYNESLRTMFMLKYM